MLNTGSIPSIGVTPEAAYTDNGYTTSAGTSHTFSSMSIGAADTNRYVIVGIGCFDLSNQGTTYSPTSLTVGGISATKIAGGVSGVDSGFTTGCSLWRAAVPTGTTATVIAYWDDTISRCQVTTYRLIHSNGTPEDTDAQVSTTANFVTLTLTTPNVGIAYSAIRDNNAGTDVAWSGTASPVEDFEQTETYNAYAGASFITDGTVIATHTGNEVVSAVAATW